MGRTKDMFIELMNDDACNGYAPYDDRLDEEHEHTGGYAQDTDGDDQNDGEDA